MISGLSTTWPTKKVGDLCDVSRGSSPRPIKNQRYFDGGNIPWVKIADATKSGKYLYETKQYVNDYGASFSKKLKPGTILVAASGTLGYTQILGVEACAHDGWLILQNLHDLDRDYAYYTLQWMERHFFNAAYGAAIQNINTQILRDTQIPCPKNETQRKIAITLSAYDDLIENNLRRIKILEEMAQNLYREWFVRFRFPGHEPVRMVDSPLGKIPEGWEVAQLGQYLSGLESGKRPKGGVGDLMNGIPSIGAENVIGIGVHNYQNEKFVSQDFFQTIKKGIAQDGDVALYKDGAYIGRSTYFRDGFPHANFCVNEHVFLLRSTGDQLTQNALYLWLKESTTISAIRAMNANAAQPGINQKGVNGLELIVPSKEIASRFDEVVEPYLALIVSFAKCNNMLRQTRDLLLPKLISGELDVSELDIITGQEVT